MPTYPTTRRFFSDDEFRNENAAIAGAVRALALAQNYRYARDLKVTPSDAKTFAEAGWAWSASSLASTPVRSFGTGSGWYASANVAEIVVPDPRAPATRILVSVNIVRAAAGAVSGFVDVTNARTGEVATITVLDSGTDQWLSADVSARTGDVLRVAGRWASGTNFTVAAISAWWSPASLAMPGADFALGWSALSQAFHTTNSPLSSYALTWLGRTANAWAFERPMMVANSWLYNPAAGTGAGYSSYSTTVGKYRVYIGARCPSLTVRLRYRASGACTVGVALDGGAGSGTVTISGAGTSVASTTVTLTPGAGAFDTVTLTVQGAPTYCDIEYVLIYENYSTASSLALPAGETVPASFDPNLDERISSGRAIRADDIARLFANEVWLWAYRRDRILVSDCRFTYKETRLDAFTGASGLTDRAAMHEVVTSKRNAGAAFGELLVRVGYHQGAGFGTPTPWEALNFQVGLATYGDSVGAPAVGLGFQYQEGPRVDWSSHSQAAHQHRRGGTVSEGTVYLLETIILTAGHDVAINKMTRPSWLTVEELPLGTPAATYP